MDDDLDEFLNIVGTRHDICGETLLATIAIDGKLLCENLPLKCGNQVNQKCEKEGTLCTRCGLHVVPCDCGHGVGFDLCEDPTIPVCSPEFCPKRQHGS